MQSSNTPWKDCAVLERGVEERRKDKTMCIYKISVSGRPAQEESENRQGYKVIPPCPCKKDRRRKEREKKTRRKVNERSCFLCMRCVPIIPEIESWRKRLAWAM